MAEPLTDDEVARLAVFWAHAARAQLARLGKALNRLDNYPGRGEASPTVGDWWQVAAERHFALLAIAHVVKACSRLEALPRFPDADLFTYLRHYAEHWEDPSGRAGRTLAEIRPEHTEEPIAFWPERFALHGVFSDDLDAWLAEVDRVARSTDGSGLPMPDPSTPLD
ncbi:hypothetical protein [Demequina maris]|uniref:hypothetical protein n=1 Tax=Demequina maris TaxID=1638982 RepID=UPI000AFC6030|nr:hypothetical protein [Demequina maris]